MTYATLTPPNIILGDIRASSLHIASLVSIDMKTGEVTYGSDYTPDAAAKAFWNALSSEYATFQSERAELEMWRSHCCEGI